MKKVFEEFQVAIRETADLDQALELAHAYGNLLWFADVGIHDAPEVELDLIDRCARLADLPLAPGVEGSVNVLHVITEPLMTGGHTRLMERLTRMQDAPADLLISRSTSREALHHVSSFFHRTTVIASRQMCDALVEMVTLLCGYQKVVLHIHPDDIAVVVACGIAKRIVPLSVFFVNHADHVFSYGSTVADFYFELSAHGRRFDLTKNIAGQKSFLGIPVDTQQAIKSTDLRPSTHDQLLFISAGSDIKYKPRKGADMFALISRILDDYPRSRFLIIGTDIRTSFWWWPLKLKYRSRLEIRSHLNFKEYGELVSQADYYVDSHPLPGGTAFAEQFIKGRRCVGLLAPLQGYSSADRLKRSSIDGVMRSIANYQYADDVFLAIESVNSFEAVRARYLKCLDEGAVSENPFDALSTWEGSDHFFENTGRSLNIDVAVSSFDVFFRLQRNLSLRLLMALSLKKQIKLVVKMLLAGIRR